MICTYLLVVERGFKIATLARDSFSKLLATGLTAVFALQVFVIVGGVTQVIPLTGVTLPFISYGGSSILANFVLLALLLLVSERARAEAETPHEHADHPPLRRLPACCSRCSSSARRGTRCSAPTTLRNKPQNRRQLLEQQRIRRGVDPRRGRRAARAQRAPRPTDTLHAPYPKNGLFAHAVGYSYTRYGRAGLEQSRNDALSRHDERARRRSSTA